MIVIPPVMVVNTSPLIHLAEANRLDLLRDAARAIWVPEPVACEIHTYGDNDPTAHALITNPWLEIKAVPTLPARILAWNLGPGESSVLTLAESCRSAVAVIDDLAGRRCAEALGLPLTGTVGLVLLAKKLGRIASARKMLEMLRDHGMFLSDKVINQALQWIDE
jgi:predicted nucleic acid-binding protein